METHVGDYNQDQDKSERRVGDRTQVSNQLVVIFACSVPSSTLGENPDDLMVINVTSLNRGGAGCNSSRLFT